MRSEPELAMTVHHKGRKYRAGMTAEDIGPAAAEIGKHAWVDGIAPAKTPDKDAQAGGTPAGSPVVPTPSALPTPPVPEEPGSAGPAEPVDPVTAGPAEPVDDTKPAGRRNTRAGS